MTTTSSTIPPQRTTNRNIAGNSIPSDNRKNVEGGRKKPLRAHSNIQRATIKVDLSEKKKISSDDTQSKSTPRIQEKDIVTARSGSKRLTNSPSMGEIRTKKYTENQENEPVPQERTRIKKPISRETSKKKSITTSSTGSSSKTGEHLPTIVSPRNSVRSVKPLVLDERGKKKRSLYNTNSSLIEDSADTLEYLRKDSDIESPRTERSSDPVLKIGLVGWSQGKHVVIALNSTHNISKKSRMIDMEVQMVWDPKISESSQIDQPLIKFTHNFSTLLNPHIDIIGFYYEDHDINLEFMLEALKNGKNVIVEYPLVFNLHQARKINSEIENLTGNLRVVQITQVIPSFIHQQKEYTKGSIGELEMVEVHYLGWNIYECNIDYQYRPIKALSSVVTMIRCFINRIESVHAFSKPSHQARSYSPVIDDIYIVNILSKTGEMAKATVNCCLSVPEKVIRCKLFGSKGISEASYPDMLYTQLNSDSDHPITHEFLTPENTEFYFNQKEKNSSNIPFGCYSNYFNHFARAIVAHQNDKIKLNIVQGLQTAIIVEAIRRSVIEKRSVKIKEIRNEVFAH